MFAIVKRECENVPTGCLPYQNSKTAKQQNTKSAYAFPTIRLFAALLAKVRFGKSAIKKKTLVQFVLVGLQ